MPATLQTGVISTMRLHKRRASLEFLTNSRASAWAWVCAVCPEPARLILPSRRIPALVSKGSASTQRTSLGKEPTAAQRRRGTTTATGPRSGATILMRLAETLVNSECRNPGCATTWEEISRVPQACAKLHSLLCSLLHHVGVLRGAASLILTTMQQSLKACLISRLK